MSGDSDAIQAAVYRTLCGDSQLAGLLAADYYESSPTGPAVYSKAPQVPKPEEETRFPYVVLGDDAAAPFDTDDVNGEETISSLHIWDAGDSPRRAKQIRDRVKAVLHNASLVVSGTNALFCYFNGSHSVPDPDPQLHHEVIDFRIVTQSA